MPQNAFFLRTRDLLIRQKTTQRHFFPTLHPLSTVIFATATVFAFVPLRDSRFNFHCYTQREATPTQKSARKCAATSRDFLHERLQSAFTSKPASLNRPIELPLWHSWPHKAVIPWEMYEYSGCWFYCKCFMYWSAIENDVQSWPKCTVPCESVPVLLKPYCFGQTVCR